MTRLKDISADTGFSVTTVSRALNGYPEVSKQTRLVVEEAARRLKYRPNRLAQMLQSGRSGMVAMIVPADTANPDDRSFVEIMMGLSEQLARHDLDLVFQVSVDSNPLAPYRRLLDKKTVDGFILNSPRQGDPRIRFLQDEGVPFVVHGRAPDSAPHAFFDIDNHAVGRDSVMLLADLGHRRIAFLNGHQDHGYAIRRAEGFRQAATSRGLSIPEAFVAWGADDYDAAFRSALTMLSAGHGTRPTAFVCASTPAAAGLYAAAESLSLRIPDDLSVVAHDDGLPDRRSTGFNPPLTVTHAPLRDACLPLARILMRGIHGDPVETLQQTDLATMKIRASAGPVPSGQSDPWG